MDTRKRGYLAAALAIAWLGAVTALYFVYHKPFSPGVALGAGLAAFRVLVVAALISAAGGLGRALAPDAEYRPTLQLVLQGALGMGLLSTAYLIIGWAIGVHPAVSAGLLVLIHIVFRRHVAGWWRALADLGSLLREAGGFGRLVALCILLIIGQAFMVTLAPPLKFDALVYHLALPQRYLQAGRIVYLADNAFWGMPQLAEVLYTWAMALAGAEAAAILSWAGGVLGLVGMTALASELYGPRAGWASTASVLAGYSLAASLSWGYVDWITFLYGWACLTWLWVWRKQGRLAAVWLAGLMAGFGFGVKYTAGLLAVAGAVSLVSIRPQRGEWSAALARFAGAAFLGALPWLLKNFLATGNPVYPLLVPAAEMDSVRLQFYQLHEPWGGWWDTVLLPARATFLGLDGGPGYGASIGPLLLALGGLAILAWRIFEPEQREPLRLAAMFALTGILIWAAAGRLSSLLSQTRLYLAIFPAFALLAAAGFAGLQRFQMPGVRLERVAASVIVLVLALNVFQLMTTGTPGEALRVVLNLRAPDEYQAENLGWYSLTMRAIRELPERARVLMLWEPRGYYCEPLCDPDEFLDRWVHAMRSSGGSAPVSSWRAAGYTHLLYYRAGAEFIETDDPRYAPAEWTALRTTLSGLPAPREFGGAYELYELPP